MASECSVYSFSTNTLWSSEHVDKSPRMISGHCFLELVTPALSVFLKATWKVHKSNIPRSYFIRFPNFQARLERPYSSATLTDWRWLCHQQTSHTPVLHLDHSWSMQGLRWFTVNFFSCRGRTLNTFPLFLIACLAWLFVGEKKKREKSTNPRTFLHFSYMYMSPGIVRASLWELSTCSAKKKMSVCLAPSARA